MDRRQLSFEDYESARHVARALDPSTSWSAGLGVTDRAGEHHKAIWVELRDGGPATAEELLNRLGDRATSPSGTRTRIRRLELTGRIRYTGETRETRSGNLARVMEAVPPIEWPSRKETVQ